MQHEAGIKISKNESRHAGLFKSLHVSSLMWHWINRADTRLHAHALINTHTHREHTHETRHQMCVCSSLAMVPAAVWLIQTVRAVQCTCWALIGQLFSITGNSSLPEVQLVSSVLLCLWREVFVFLIRALTRPPPNNEPDSPVTVRVFHRAAWVCSERICGPSPICQTRRACRPNYLKMFHGNNFFFHE